MAVDPLAIRLHQRRSRRPKAQAEAIILRCDLKPKGRPPRPVLIPRADAPPQMVFIRPAAEQTPRIAVNAGHLQHQRLVRQHLMDSLVHLCTQLLHRLQKCILIHLLILHEPAPLVVEADAPHEIHRRVRKALKHTLYLLFFLNFLLCILPRRKKFCKCCIYDFLSQANRGIINPQSKKQRFFTYGRENDYEQSSI